MVKLTINKESYPQRCEICHQEDYFDTITNHCSRCSGIRPLTLKEQREPYKLNRKQQTPISYYIHIIFRSILSLVITPVLGVIITKLMTLLIPPNLIAKDVWWADGLSIFFSVIISTFILGLVVGLTNVRKLNGVILATVVALCLSVPISLVCCSTKLILSIYPIISVVLSGILVGLIFGSFYKFPKKK